MSWLLNFYFGSFDWELIWDLDELLDLIAPPMAAK
ncbi:hypothetical protein CCANI_04155 [Corynebacterium canis]|nr:hypothetical protein CCANI_04155 [Corynebacterium canis]